MVAKSDSFAATVTLSFWATGDGFSRTRGAALTVRHAPHGNTTIVDRGGRDVRKVSFSALVDASAQATLDSVVGDQGTLTCPGVSGVVAVLEGYEEVAWHAGTDELEVRLTFLLDSD